MLKAYNIDDMYRHMCRDIYYDGKRVGNTKEINNYIITLTNIDQCFINVRNSSKNYAAAELLWYLNGRNDVNFIGKYASLWKNLTDDGETNNSAYGYILKYKHGFDQIEKMIELLTVDPNSRRAVININIPNEHVIETKDEMCTICLNFQIRDGKLNCTGVMRSNDVYTGTVYDVPYFILIQKYIADRLNIDYGTYTHIALSLHCYDRHLDKISHIADIGTKDDICVNINHKNLFKNYKLMMDEVESNKCTPEEVFWKYGVYERVEEY